MLIKPRTISYELNMLRLLKRRMKFSPELAFHYENLEKGYTGETCFDQWLENVTSDVLILHDLLLKVNLSYFQIDTLVIAPASMYLCEVKYLKGNYYIDSQSGKWYAQPKNETKDPVLQLERCETLFKQLLHQLRFFLSNVVPFVIFPHEEFTLLQAPLELPLILPTQIPSLIRKLNNATGKLSNKHYEIANKLSSLHIDRSPFVRLPHYEFQLLRKGIPCPICQRFMISLKNKIACDVCKYTEKSSISLLRSIKEFQFLFSEKSLTTFIIHEWVDGICSKRSIRNVLVKHFDPVGYGKGTSFKNKN
ncbi:nuclease [Salipaludibacillus keqinensis]|uniref:Nuclease n=1 Tax=Salipaludibacillus keqinensis TaxID=2045207 RepID=A0A323TGD4_9BACI|nr:nuclease-related domain-containing protein [Salipaludibacillus keqinensis]PYZ91613.1 nuclease [Salipaludibacillus keqinensis]